MSLKVAVVGIEPTNVHFLTYVRYLAAQGHDVSVITNASTVDAPVRVVDFSRHTRLIKLVPSVFRVLLRAWRVRHALVSNHYDVVSIQQMTPDGVYAALLSRAPVVPTCWGSDILRLEIRPWFVRKLMPIALRRSVAVHATCEEIADRVIAMGVRPEDVETFNYGIDLDVFTSEGPEIREPHRVICTRGLRPFYRIPEIVRAFSQVVARYPDAHLVLAGSGWPGDREAIEELAVAVGVAGQVTLTGLLTPEGVASELRRAAVWVSVPPSDSFALSLQEAMACGAFPVVSDLRAMREGLDNERGILLKDISPETIAAALIEGIDRSPGGGHIEPNYRVIQTKGDRSVNLARFESMVVRAARRGATTQE